MKYEERGRMLESRTAAMIPRSAKTVGFPSRGRLFCGAAFHKEKTDQTGISKRARQAGLGLEKGRPGLPRKGVWLLL